MTIKKIAELCGVDRRTVERWAHKVSDDPGQNAQGLAEKLKEAEKSGKDPADFTLDETLAIIGEGGGNKPLASLLAENARNKDALAVNAPRTREEFLTRLERIESSVTEKVAARIEHLTQLAEKIEARLLPPQERVGGSVPYMPPHTNNYSIIYFAQHNLFITGDAADCEPVSEVLARYLDQGGDKMKSSSFIARMRRTYPSIDVTTKKLNGFEVAAFIGCRLMPVKELEN
jgi:transcriptional regulator with XRE-family HTH domain